MLLVCEDVVGIQPFFRENFISFKNDFVSYTRNCTKCASVLKGISQPLILKY